MSSNPLARGVNDVVTGSMMPSQSRAENDALFYFSSHDRVLSEWVEETSSKVPDDTQTFKVMTLFKLVKDLLAKITGIFQEPDRAEGTSEPGNEYSTDYFSNLGHIVDCIAFELSTGVDPELAETEADYLASEQWGRADRARDAHKTTMSILKLLSYYAYAWEEKAAYTLASFAMKYGEDLLLLTLPNNSLAGALALLKQMRSFPESFMGIAKLTQALLDATESVIRFSELDLCYVPQDDPARKAATTLVRIAVYWIVRGVVIGFPSRTHIPTLANTNHETRMLNTVHNRFDLILNKLNEQIDEGMENEAYRQLEMVVDNPKVADNMPFLTRIFDIGHDDSHNLYDCKNRTRVDHRSLRRKNVLLLISDLEISLEELSVFKKIYDRSKNDSCEVLWLPIVERSVPWTGSMQAQFEQLRSRMLWYSVHQPTDVKKAFVKFARTRWRFRSKPLLAVLDRWGRVWRSNAVHMMLVWGSDAFPFTTQKEEMLWEGQTWCLDLLVYDIDTAVIDWIAEDKYIFIYGGDDINLIRRFTKEAHEVAQTAGIKLEMLYVGKSGKREVAQRISSAIESEPEIISSCWKEASTVWFFWHRIKSMLYSKMELKKGDDPSDVIMQQVKRLLSYDKIPGGWALLSRGSEVMVLAQMATVLTALARYEREPPYWKNKIPPLAFHEAFRQQVASVHVEDLPCCKFEFPAIEDPVGMVCPECPNAMDKYTTFTCCHEGPAHKHFGSGVESVARPT